MKRILITGSRRWTDAEAIRDAIATAIGDYDGPVTIVHGGARGADQLAAALATTFGPDVTAERWPADWDGDCRNACHTGHRQPRNGTSFCPMAGIYRNADMVAAGADICLAFPLGESRGTRDCMDRATAAGIPVIDITAPSEPEGLW